VNSDASPVALGVLFAVTVVTLGLGARHLVGILLARRFDARLIDGHTPWNPQLPWRRVLIIGAPVVALLALGAAVAAALVGGSHSHAPAADPPARAAVSGASVSRINSAPVIRVAGGSTLKQLGAWSLRDPSIAAATAAFGRPSSERGGRGCTASWAHAALTVTSASRACEAAATVSTITVHGRWRTWAGLRVGDPVSAIRARHPHAIAHGTVWWLPTPAVAAIVRGGRVAAFRLTVGS
jgi:hypothetical protein